MASSAGVGIVKRAPFMWVECAVPSSATIAPGFPKRDDVRGRYAERSGRDLGQIDFFVALGYWKLAIILEGVYARYASGQYGKTDEGFEQFAKIVERLAAAASDAVDRLP